MNSEENQPGTWLQRLWWGIRDLYHQLKPCRFSILVALIAFPVFLCVAQGTEILRVVGEGLATNESYWPRVFGFFAALMLWALSSWYATRVLLYLDFPSPGRVPVRSKLAETHVPRLLGVAPILIVGCGFFVAASSYAPTACRQSFGCISSRRCVPCWLLCSIVYLILRMFGLATSVQERPKRLSQHWAGDDSWCCEHNVDCLIVPLHCLHDCSCPGRAKDRHGNNLAFGRGLVDQPWQFIRLPRWSLAVPSDYHLYLIGLSFQFLER